MASEEDANLFVSDSTAASNAVGQRWNARRGWLTITWADGKQAMVRLVRSERTREVRVVKGRRVKRVKIESEIEIAAPDAIVRRKK